MSGTNQEKIALYVGYALVLAISLLGYDGAGLYDGCGFLQRISYPLYHQNIFHALINLWVFHQCFRSIPCGWNLVIFYLIAVSYPFTTTTPIIGLSGLVYAYMGFIAPYVEKKVKYNLTILFYISIGLVFPNMAIGVHIYCYILGLLWGYLNAPLCQDL